MFSTRTRIATGAAILLSLVVGHVPVHSQAAPRVIEITAQRFEFKPNQITLKKSEPVILRIHSEDVTHGFFSRPLKVDNDLEAGDTTDIKLTPDKAGTFSVICDHFCGSGHGNMKLAVTVTE